MLIRGLDVPWRGEAQSARFDVRGFIDLLETQNPAIGTAQYDLLTALRHARSRSQEDPWGTGQHVRYAQAVLEIAVEWSMPAVERWAVAWLMALGGSHLRLRWSSRSRDGKVRRDGRAVSPVTTLASGRGRVMIGCASGELREWTDEAGLSPLLRSDRRNRPIWAIADRDDRVVAGGANGLFLTEPETWVVPQPGETHRVAGITAVAISPAGSVACGDNKGQVWVSAPDGGWTGLRMLDDATVLALSFRGDDTIRAVSETGWMVEFQPAPAGKWIGREPRKLSTGPASDLIMAAAFDETGERLAIAIRGSVNVFQLPEVKQSVGWTHPDVRAVAWSPVGLLASSGEQSLLVGEPGLTGPEPIRGDTAGGLVAFLGADHLVTAKELEIVQWAVREAGSDVPVALVDDEITSIGLDPSDRGYVMAGTRHGRLLSYDARGSADLLLAGDDIGGTVHQIVRRGDEWLLAAQTGPYRWRLPDGNMPILLGGISCLCLAVAARGQDAAYAAYNQVFTLSEEPPLTFKRAVCDICLGPGGSVAAIDASGTIKVKDQAGDVWPVPGLPDRQGWRLLDFNGQFVRVWDPNALPPVQDGAVLAIPRYGRYRKVGVVPADAIHVLKFDSRRVVVVCPGRGIGLAATGGTYARATPIIGVPTQATVAGTDGYRIVAAAGKRIVGYDLLESAESGPEGVLTLRTAAAGDTCSVRLPDDTVLKLRSEQVNALRSIRDASFEELAELAKTDLDISRFRELAASATFDEQSSLLTAASDIGDLLWQSGLALSVDRARGDNPDRPLRMEWHCDDQTDEIPWELVHPSAAPLGWFDDSPITTVRSVEPRYTQPGERAPAGGPLVRYTMLALRGTEVELASSNEAYARTQRRTRRTNVSFLSRRPLVIKERDDLRRVLPASVDILQVWAHCDPTEIQFSPRAVISVAELADILARCGPRLVVLVGCRSGALGRALIERGVEAVVAMRVEVYSRTIQPLVEDVVSLALTGTPVDLAFADALRSYVLTGQPGAAAVPMLYLAAGSSGKLFSSSVQSTSALHHNLGGSYNDRKVIVSIILRFHPLHRGRPQTRSP